MCLFCEWENAVDEIDVMLNDDDHRYAWAYDTLAGIKKTIEDRGHATDNQKRAVENIRRKR